MFCLVYVYCVLFSFYSVWWCGGVVIFWGDFIYLDFYFLDFVFLRFLFFWGLFCFLILFYIILYSFSGGVLCLCVFLIFGAFICFLGLFIFLVVFLTFILSFFLFCQTFLDFLAVCFLSFNSSKLYFFSDNYFISLFLYFVLIF